MTLHIISLLININHTNNSSYNFKIVTQVVSNFFPQITNIIYTKTKDYNECRLEIYFKNIWILFK